MAVHQTQFTRIVILFLALIVKISNAQNFEWAKSIGGPGSDRPGTLILDPIGNIFIMGSFQGTVDFDPGPGIFNSTSTSQNGDIFILKLSPNGSFKWVKIISGTHVSSNKDCLSIDASGNVYTTGFFTGSVDLDPGPGNYTLTSWGGYIVFINKLDSSGNFIWGKSLGTGGISCTSHNLACDSYGNLYLTGGMGSAGSSQIGIDFDPGPTTYSLFSNGQYDVWLLKLDSAGSFIWAKSFGGISNDIAYSLHVRPNGELYLSGNFEGTCDLNPDPGSYLVTASVQGGSYVSSFDSLGNFVWGRTFGDGIPISVKADASAHVYISGYFTGSQDFDPGPSTYSIASLGGVDSYILKLSPTGNFNWVRAIGGFWHDHNSCLRIDTKGNILTMGSFSSTVDFNPGPNINTQTSSGWYDSYLLKLDSSGNYVYAKTLSGLDSASASFPESFAINSNDEIYITGNLLKTVDFDPGYFQYNLTSNGVYDAFILKLSPCKLSFGRDSIIRACEGENIILAAPGAAVYNWNPGSINSSSLSFIATSPISYTVVGALSPDCSDTLIFNLQVSACLNSTLYETTSENSILIFPNPSNGRFLIQAQIPTPIKITDELGRLILTSELKQEDKYTLEVNLSKPGVYFLVSNYRSQKLVVIQ